MLDCGGVGHPGGMAKDRSQLKGILRVRVNTLHGGAHLLKTAPS